MWLARPAPELASLVPQRRVIAANEGRGPLLPARDAHQEPESTRDPPERTALWSWAEPSRPDAP